MPVLAGFPCRVRQRSINYIRFHKYSQQKRVSRAIVTTHSKRNRKNDRPQARTNQIHTGNEENDRPRAGTNQIHTGNGHRF